MPPRTDPSSGEKGAGEEDGVEDVAALVPETEVSTPGAPAGPGRPGPELAPGARTGRRRERAEGRHVTATVGPSKSNSMKTTPGTARMQMHLFPASLPERLLSAAAAFSCALTVAPAWGRSRAVRAGTACAFTTSALPASLPARWPSAAAAFSCTAASPFL